MVSKKRDSTHKFTFVPESYPTLCTKLRQKNRKFLLIGCILLSVWFFTVYITMGNIKGIVRYARDLFVAGSFIYPAVAFYLLYLYSQRKGDISKHLDIKRFLESDSPAKYLTLFESEIKDENSRTPFKKCFITEHFVVSETFSGLKWIRSSEIVWAYLHETKVRYLFLITLHTTRGVNIRLDNGMTYDISCSSKEEAINILSLLAKRAPFAVYGYNDDLKRLWDKDKTGFIREVKNNADKRARKS